MIEPLEQRLQFTALPAGFNESLIAGNLGNPTSMDVLPDGRVLVADQLGALRVIKNGAVLATPFVTHKVDAAGERGLLGVTHDPNFATNGFIYIYHTVPISNGQAAHNVVTRYTANGDVAQSGSGVDILRLDALSSATNHNGGAMHFGKDGMLYVATGENANPPFAQTLSNQLGKILRINVSNVQIGDPVNNVAKIVPSNNPFVGSTGGTINGSIYALGFRNPFTFAVNSIDGTIYVDDVGQDTWEEVNRLVAGGNYGWNRVEGFAATTPTNLGPGTYQQPALAYNHNGGPAGGGIAIVGGAFYTPPAGASNPFPSAYIGKFFYGDLGANFIRTLNPAMPGSVSNPDTSSPFATGTEPNPVNFALAPDGGLYYLVRGNGGKLVKISYTASVAPAITQQPANKTVTRGAAVTFSVAASGTSPLQYQWQRNSGANGAFVDLSGATGANYTFTTASADNGAKFRVVVRNNVGSATSNVATLTVTTNTAPTAAITFTGLRNGKFDAGSPLRATFSATDAEDGNINYKYFTYKIDYITSLNSVPGGVVRPFVSLQKGKLYANFTPAATGPYTNTDVAYRVTFSVKDSGGLVTTVVRDIFPNTVTLTLGTAPTGLKLNVDGQSRTAPTSFGSVVGFNRLLDAPTSQSLSGRTWIFSSWSDGGAASHSIVTPNVNRTYTATYK